MMTTGGVAVKKLVIATTIAAAIAPPSAVAGPKEMFMRLDKDKDGRVTQEEYVGVFDPTFPHFDRNKDTHFPMDCLAASYHAARGPRMVTLIPKLGHGHQPPWNAPDSYAFAESVVRSGKPWCRQTAVGLEDVRAHASFASTKPLDRAQLVSTTDTGFTGKRNWVGSPAELRKRDDGIWHVTAPLVAGSTAWFINVHSGELTVSSDYQEVVQPKSLSTPKPKPGSAAPDVMWTYKKVDDKELEMSVFLPEGYDEGNRFPAFVVFHGGSWNAGDPNWHYPDCAYWSGRGMIAVSVGYRLRDKVRVPLECVKDAKSAIRFLRKNAASLKVDPDRIVAAGGSAGGQLAAATATLDAKETNDDQYDLSISCKPNAVILYNPC